MPTALLVRHLDLLRPPSDSDADRRAALLCLLLRDLCEQTRQPALQEASAELIASLREALALFDKLLDGFTAGYNEANRLDQAAAAEQAERERFLGALGDSLTFAGAAAPPESYTLFGWQDGRPVALARDGGQILLACGMIGSGKSQAATNLIEGHLAHVPGISSAAHRDTAVLSFFAAPDGVSLPEALFGLFPNDAAGDRDTLGRCLGVAPAPIPRMRLCVPAWLLPEYEAATRPYRDLGLSLSPLRLSLAQLPISALEALLCADRDASYVHFLLEEAQAQGDGLTIESWQRRIEEARELNAAQKRAAHRRLQLLSRIVAPEADLWDLCHPGEYTIFCLGGRRIRHDDTLPLIMAVMNAASQPSERHGPFQRLFVLDEINQLLTDPALAQHLLLLGRQIRHRGSTLLLLGQDLLGLPDELIALATMMAVFRLRSPRIFDHLRERMTGFSGCRFDEIAALLPGQALVAVADSTDEAWARRAKKVYFRPLRCRHGGFTRATI